jgi:hypothetical protein
MDVSLALKMTLRTDYYADAEPFEIQGEEGIVQVTRCSKATRSDARCQNSAANRIER